MKVWGIPMINRLCVALIVAVAVLGCALAASMSVGGRIRKEYRRLEGNQQALLEQVREYRVRDSLHAVTIGVLSIRAAEVEQHFGALAEMVRDLGIKMRRVESVSEQTIESQYAIHAHVENTPVGVDPSTTTGDTTHIAQRIRYRDPYLDFDGMIRQGIFEGKIVCRDTLTQVVHRVPRKFLFVRWGTKAIQQEIVSSNPHTRIVYARFINVVK